MTHKTDLSHSNAPVFFFNFFDSAINIDLKMSSGILPVS